MSHSPRAPISRGSVPHPACRSTMTTALTRAPGRCRSRSPRSSPSSPRRAPRRWGGGGRSPEMECSSRRAARRGQARRPERDRPRGSTRRCPTRSSTRSRDDTPIARKVPAGTTTSSHATTRCSDSEGKTSTAQSSLTCCTSHESGSISTAAQARTSSPAPRCWLACTSPSRRRQPARGLRPRPACNGGTSRGASSGSRMRRTIRPRAARWSRRGGSPASWYGARRSSDGFRLAGARGPPPRSTSGAARCRPRGRSGPGTPPARLRRS